MQWILQTVSQNKSFKFAYYQYFCHRGHADQHTCCCVCSWKFMHTHVLTHAYENLMSSTKIHCNVIWFTEVPCSTSLSHSHLPSC